MATKKTTTTTEAPKVCSQTQQRFLLREIPSKYSIRRLKRPPEPAAVTAARKKKAEADKIIARSDADYMRQVEKREEQFAALESNARKAIYFGTPEEALAAVDRLKAWVRNPKP